MRNYELTFIVASDVTEDELGVIVNQVQTWIEEGKGKITKVDQWGRRRLAYSIKEFQEGHYVTLTTEMEPQATFELERNLKLATRLLRYLLVRLDE